MRLMLDNGHKCAQDDQNIAYEYGAVIAWSIPCIHQWYNTSWASVGYPESTSKCEQNIIPRFNFLAPVLPSMLDSDLCH